MATVTSFEAQPYPSKSELKQFAELFAPLFQASSEEAKCQAVAALSQCPNVPPAVAFFIGNQPISIAALFLTRSPVITDDMLITIARSQGAAHAKAIARRENLSPSVIDALVGLRQASLERGANDLPSEAPSDRREAAGNPALSAAETQATVEESPAWREEALRDELRKLSRHFFPSDDDGLGLRSLNDIQGALFVRFARSREADNFSMALADALSASRWLAERIMLDISGQQPAATLISFAIAQADIVFILTRFYPHLCATEDGISRAQHLVDGLNRSDCVRRVEACRRADSYTYASEEREKSRLQASR